VAVDVEVDHEGSPLKADPPLAEKLKVKSLKLQLKIDDLP